MNPLVVVPFLGWSLLASVWPAQVDRERRAAKLLLSEAGVLLVAAVAGYFLARLVEPRAVGLWWGRTALLASMYLYVCARGVVLVRAVLDIPDLRMRRDDDRTAGAVQIARGRVIGILERALALTLVLLGQYGALGLVVAAKSLARMKALDDREFAEYFLIGTLASLLLAVAGGVALRLLL